MVMAEGSLLYIHLNWRKSGLWSNDDSNSCQESEYGPTLYMNFVFSIELACLKTVTCWLNLNVVSHSLVDVAFGLTAACTERLAWELLSCITLAILLKSWPWGNYEKAAVVSMGCPPQCLKGWREVCEKWLDDEGIINQLHLEGVWSKQCIFSPGSSLDFSLLPVHHALSSYSSATPLCHVILS